MKKLLAILLIAIVACSTASVVEEKKFDLPEWVNKVWSKLLKAFKKVVEYLKENGLLDPIVKLLKGIGLVVPKELCLKVYDGEFCDELLGGLFKEPEDGEVVLKSFWSWVKTALEIVIDIIIMII